MNAARHAGTRQSGNSLSRLAPVDAAPFRQPSSPWFIWFTIIVAWMLSMLPWRMWAPAPNLLLLVIAFWALNEPRRIGLFTAFFFGLLLDVHDGMLLGGQALSYTLVAYGAVLLSRRLRRFNAIVQAVHLMPVLFLAMAVKQVCYAWLVGGWAGWGWAISALLTTALWPVADMLLLLPQRRRDAVDAGSV